MEINEVQETVETKPPIWKGVLIVALFLLVVFGIWYFSSGIREDVTKRLNATSTPVKVVPKKQLDTPETLELSYYNRWIKFIPGASLKESYPEKEYVEIDVVQPNLSGADATKWVLENSLGEKTTLGEASILPVSGKINETTALKVKAGDHLIVSTGRSPIGVSFRVNKCSSYLEQFQDFVPPIPGECPPIGYEKDFNSLDRDCHIFLQGIHACEANTRTVPPEMSVNCKTFMNTAVNYSGCVAIHKNDPDFYKKDWRIFLGKEKELWAQLHDTVMLLDEKGKLIDSVKY